MADTAPDTAAFLAQLQPRISAVTAMPASETRAANIVLLLSDIFAYTGKLGADWQQSNSNFGSPSSAYIQADAIYNSFGSWSNPAAAERIITLRTLMASLQQKVEALSASATTLQTSVQSLSAGLATVGPKIQAEFAAKPIGATTTNVVAWGNATTASFGAMAALFVNYSAKMNQYMDAINSDRNPGNLSSELSALEAQIQSFQPVAGYSYSAISQVFETDSSTIRSQYPGMK
jgi:hypothetical protein